MTASSQLPEAQEQALDEYPMPDAQVSTPDMLKYGYSYDGMLPVTRERALELDAAGLTCLLYTSRYGQQNPQTSRILQQLSTLSTDAGG